MYPEQIDYDQFKIADDGKTLYWVVGDKEIRITAKRVKRHFFHLAPL